MRKTLARVGVLAAVSTLAVLGFAGAASAHVTVSSSNAVQGGDATLTFVVPNEEDTATTVTVEVDLPATAPFTGVDVKPIAGWTATVSSTKLATPLKDDDGNTITEAVSKIVWTATGDAAIQPGQFQEFDVSAGPMPDADSITFKALQTYSNGDVVRWIDESKAGQPEPDHPAPTLKLAKADDAAPAAAESTSTGGSSTTATLALVFAIIALVVALGGLGLILTQRRKASAS
jgi:periplasmic copper chaperone A